MTTGFETVVSYMPEQRVTAADYQHLAALMPAWMGMPREKRRFPDPKANEIMAVEVAKKALASASLEPADVDLIVCQSFGGRYIVPGLAGFVHKQLGFRRNIPAWNVQDICASFLDGCEIASNALVAHPEYRRVLVMAVSALETGGWGTDPTAPVAAVMGDGAAAAIISRDRLRGEFMVYNTETYGEVYEPAVMAFDPPDHPEMLQGTNWVVNKGGCGPHLTPEFEPLFQSILANMAADGLKSACRKAGIKPSDIDMVIAHQAFPGLLDIWSQSAEPIGVPTARWRSTYDRYGNVGACDVPVTIADLVAENAIPAGATVALFAPGGGGHTPTILMRWNG